MKFGAIYIWLKHIILVENLLFSLLFAFGFGVAVKGLVMYIKVGKWGERTFWTNVLGKKVYILLKTLLIS